MKIEKTQITRTHAWRLSTPSALIAASFQKKNVLEIYEHAIPSR
jgi:hypothetical protein